MKMIKRVLSILMTVSLMSAAFGFAHIDASAAQTTHTITFDVQGIGETPDPITVNDGDRYLYLRENNPDNPTADGYVFHCWVTTLDFEPDEIAMSNTAAYLETPVTEDMTLYAVWYKLIDRVDVTVDPPVPGDVIGTDRYETEDYSFEYQSPRPHAAVTSEGARVQDNFWSAIGPSAFWLEDPDDYESAFKGTFENGKVYGVMIDTEPVFGYQFEQELTVTVNGVTVEKPFYADHNLCTIKAPILCGEAVPAETVTAKDSHKNNSYATKDSATKDRSTVKKTPASGNPYAVKTGSVYPCFFCGLLFLSSVILFFYRRKTKIR